MLEEIRWQTLASVPVDVSVGRRAELAAMVCTRVLANEQVVVHRRAAEQQDTKRRAGKRHEPGPLRNFFALVLDRRGRRRRDSRNSGRARVSRVRRQIRSRCALIAFQFGSLPIGTQRRANAIRNRRENSADPTLGVTPGFFGASQVRAWQACVCIT